MQEDQKNTNEYTVHFHPETAETIVLKSGEVLWFGVKDQASG